MNALFSTLAAALLTLSPASASTGGDHWYADYDEAAAVAKKEGKDLLVDFTGSDWCGWCIRLHKEVFDFEEFLKPVTDQYVLVALDFPKADDIKAKVPNPERNAELQGKYGVRGFPTILLMTADGEVFGRTGYQKGGPEKYVEHLNQLREEGMVAIKQVKDLLASVEGKEGAAYEKALTAVLDEFGRMKPDSVGRASLSAALVSGLDKGLSKDLTLSVVDTLITAGVSGPVVRKRAMEIDPANAEGLLERLLEGQCKVVSDEATCKAAIAAIAEFDGQFAFKDEKRGFSIYYMAARWSAGPLQDTEQAKTWATKAKKIGTSDPKAEAWLDRIIES